MPLKYTNIMFQKIDHHTNASEIDHHSNASEIDQHYVSKIDRHTNAWEIDHHYNGSDFNSESLRKDLFCNASDKGPFWIYQKMTVTLMPQKQSSISIPSYYYLNTNAVFWWQIGIEIACCSLSPGETFFKLSVLVSNKFKRVYECLMTWASTIN